MTKRPRPTLASTSGKGQNMGRCTRPGCGMEVIADGRFYWWEGAPMVHPYPEHCMLLWRARALSAEKLLRAASAPPTRRGRKGRK